MTGLREPTASSAWAWCPTDATAIAEGLIFSYPVTCADGDWRIVDGLAVDDFSRSKLDITEAELVEERDEVAGLLG